MVENTALKIKYGFNIIILRIYDISNSARVLNFNGFLEGLGLNVFSKMREILIKSRICNYLNALQNR